nr:MAG TPA: hypothetical protein [Microviridae sp.]
MTVFLKKNGFYFVVIKRFSSFVAHKKEMA